MAKAKLTADALCDALWDTLHQVKSGDMHPSEADSVATQAREILRTRKTQLAIQKHVGMAATEDLKGFASK